ncbi:MAG: ABC transporter ATP-binding protein [Holophagales bacterium]|nr:ABC transporter ATP-binding protein [Holophagales bacterium]
MNPSPTARDPLLRATGVYHAYDRRLVVRGASLEVRAGEVHCLLGPSGSGKSTLLRLIAGLEPLQRGKIEIAGSTVAEAFLAGGGAERGHAHVPPERRSVGFVFQDYALFPHLSVLDNVRFGMRGGSRREQLRAARALLERVGMGAHATAMPHTLSGGQQQRTALARALATEPAVMLLDEPFSGLDAVLRRSVRETTLEILREAQVATVMVTHDPEEALLVSDCSSVILDGRIEQSGTPEDIYARSASRPVAEVFGPLNRWPGRVLGGQVDTPWGPVAAGELDDGAEVEVAVRPESMVLRERHGNGQAPLAGARRGTIAAAVAAGGLLHLEVVLEGGEQLHVRDRPRQRWLPGRKVWVDLDSATPMVYPRPGAEDAEGEGRRAMAEPISPSCPSQ